MPLRSQHLPAQRPVAQPQCQIPDQNKSARNLQFHCGERTRRVAN